MTDISNASTYSNLINQLDFSAQSSVSAGALPFGKPPVAQLTQGERSHPTSGFHLHGMDLRNKLGQRDNCCDTPEWTQPPRLHGSLGIIRGL